MANSTAFASVSYTAVSEETTDGPAPDYDEIIDEEKEPSKTIDSIAPANPQPDSNYYCGTPQPLENNSDGTIVSFFLSTPDSYMHDERKN